MSESFGSCVCPGRSSDNLPRNLQQDKCYFLFCNFLPLYEWEAIIRNLKMSYLVYIFQAIGKPGSLGGASCKELACQSKRHKRPGSDPWIRKISWRREWQPTPVFLPGEFHGQRNLGSSVHRVTKSRTWLKWLSTEYVCLIGKISLQKAQS